MLIPVNGIRTLCLFAICYLYFSSSSFDVGEGWFARSLHHDRHTSFVGAGLIQALLPFFLLENLYAGPWSPLCSQLPCCMH